MSCLVVVLLFNTLTYLFQLSGGGDDVIIDGPPTMKTTIDTNPKLTAVAVTPTEENESETVASKQKSTTTDNNNNTNDIDDDDSFSACIMWMDENYRLEEWLAYHYYVLKLRYVVITIDTKSETSPQAIIDRWTNNDNANLNMTIVTMTPPKYMINYRMWMKRIELSRVTPTEENMYTNVDYIIKNQKAFYRACTRHLIEQNRTWTSYHDLDEFVTFGDGNDDPQALALHTHKMKQPGYILHRLNSIKQQMAPDSYVNVTGLSCLAIDRKRYVSRELSPEETDELFTPPITPIIPSSTSISLSSSSSSLLDLDPCFPKDFMNISSIDSSTYEDRKNVLQQFSTLRYKYLDPNPNPKTPGKDGGPKSFIDLSQRNPKLFAADKYRKKNEIYQGSHYYVHEVMRRLCKKEWRNRNQKTKNLVSMERFVINHYIGSWASYSYKDDRRKGSLRTYDIWAQRANATNGEFSHIVRPWLKGFVNLVGGPQVASYLLQDAGKFPLNYDATVRIHDYNFTHVHGAVHIGDNTKKK